MTAYWQRSRLFPWHRISWESYSLLLPWINAGDPFVDGVELRVTDGDPPDCDVAEADSRAPLVDKDG